MSIVYHETTIDSTGQVNYTKNGVTTNLTKVYYHKNGVDTLVWSKERNQMTSTNNVVSASGGTTLNYAVGEPSPSVVEGCVSAQGGDWRIQQRALGTYDNTYTGNEIFGKSTCSGGTTNFDGVVYQSKEAAMTAAKRQIMNTCTVTNTYTVYSYFTDTLILTINKKYAEDIHVKVYINNVLSLDEDVTEMNTSKTASYVHRNILQKPTDSVVVEVYKDDALIASQTRNMNTPINMEYEA